MTPEQYQRATKLFAAALERDPAQRDAYVSQACSDDVEVRDKVRAMLAEHQNPSANLDKPALRGINGSQLHSLLHDVDAAIPPSIGRYRIIDVLGSGGMGTVYRAEQDNPKREVALKVLSTPFAPTHLARRLEHEAYILGRLHHPNIAHIYDAGTIRDGSVVRPWFSMELIEGEPLVTYAQRRNLDIRERLELMIKVCDAVHHAHLKGVIHRDLKPANILITESGEPKILDFGVARTTDSDIQTATIQTQSGHLVGTIAYMSPEQVKGDAGALDARSDVYSLGVILYELLTGALPHEITNKPLTEAVRIVGFEDPRPLRAAAPALRGELETIVAVALERDRERRYQSAAALTDDLRAYLDHRPIRAKPTGPVLRLRKWSRRHPVTTVAAALGALAVTAILLVYFERHAAAERDRQEHIAALLTEASDLVDQYEQNRAAARQAQQTLKIVRERRSTYTTSEQQNSLDQQEREAIAVQRRRVTAFHRAIDLLLQAERLGADPTRTSLARGRLYLSRYHEAQDKRDRSEGAFYRDLVLRNDPHGTLAAQLNQYGNLPLSSEPAGATVSVFRIVDQRDVVEDGEPRLVPVPVKDVDLPVAPGTWALRVVQDKEPFKAGDVIFEVAGYPIRDVVLVAQGAGDIRRFDRLAAIDDYVIHGDYEIQTFGRSQAREPDGKALQQTKQFKFKRAGQYYNIEAASIDDLGIRVAEPDELAMLGGVPVRAWHNGEIVTATTPPGLVVRTTAAPLFLGPQTAVGVTPCVLNQVECGEYLAVYHKADHGIVRVPIRVNPTGALSTTARLPSKGEAPPGFVHVSGWNGSEPSFWIMEHEVTVAQYMQFLNDPLTLREIDASDALIRVPRWSGVEQCTRNEDGTYAPPADWPDDWPILGVSWEDAKAYARWRTHNARVAGLADTFNLPSMREQQLAWGAIDNKRYPFGWAFRPRWVSSNYARPEPFPEPVLRFPIDESTLGVYDLCGSMSEWLDDWWDESRNLRRVFGGSWGHGGHQAQEEKFSVYGYNGVPPAGTSGSIGFRLVLTRPAEK